MRSNRKPKRIGPLQLFPVLTLAGVLVILGYFYFFGMPQTSDRQTLTQIKLLTLTAVILLLAIKLFTPPSDSGR